MDSLRGKFWGFLGALVACAALAAVVAGCGSSKSSSSGAAGSGSTTIGSSTGSSTASVSPQQQALLAKLPAVLASTTAKAPDLSACMEQGARALPVAQLRELVDAGNSTAADKIQGQLANPCIAQGHGAAQVRAVVVASIKGQITASLPASFKSCVVAKATQIQPAQLAQLMADEEQGTSAGTAKLHAFGVTLGKQCASDPKVLSGLRTTFLGPVESGLKSSGYSKAFTQCVVSKAQKVSLAQLRRMVLDPAKASAYGETLGKAWAKACIASGASP